jgi:succinate dehydrogenase / fumarate reductase membrane anchor subunit
MSTPLHPTPSPTQAIIRTPLARARGLGSAKEGTDHFWRQRLTGMANVVLVTLLTGLIVSLVGSDYAAVKSTLRNPAVSILFLLFILSGTYHMRLGMQTIIEDYVHGEGAKVLLLMLNTFFAVSVALASIFAILKLSFGA